MRTINPDTVKDIVVIAEFESAMYHEIKFDDYTVEWYGETAWILGKGKRFEGMVRVDDSQDRCQKTRRIILMSIINLWEAIKSACKFRPPNYVAILQNEECQNLVIEWCREYGLPYIGDSENSVSLYSSIDPERLGPEISVLIENDSLEEKINMILYSGCDALRFLQDIHAISNRFWHWFDDVENERPLSMQRYNFAGNAIYYIDVRDGVPYLELAYSSILALARMQLLASIVSNPKKGYNSVKRCKMCHKWFIGRKNLEYCYNPCDRRKNKSLKADTREINQ